MESELARPGFANQVVKWPDAHGIAAPLPSDR